MTPARLLQHFDRISEAPNAIPRLRRFILDLAVRGKLVPQDLNDEPASELLKRIQTEKGQLRESKPGAQLQLTSEEFPFSIPFNWSWLRFGELIIDSDAS